MCVSLPVSDSVWTSISLPRCSVACTWIEENGVVRSGPLPVIEPSGYLRGAGERIGAGVRSADSGFLCTGGRVS